MRGDWLKTYRGVRISYAPMLPELRKKLSVEDAGCIENALIYAYGPIENYQGLDSLKGDFANHRFIIKNEGYLPPRFTRTLDMTELMLSPRQSNWNTASSKRRRMKEEEMRSHKGFIGLVTRIVR